ncbi:hypothetical protein ACOMCU_15985 [Lysinibacillus sp. UGB7]
MEAKKKSLIDGVRAHTKKYGFPVQKKEENKKEKKGRNKDTK